MSKLVLIETKSTFSMKYIVEVPDDMTPADALRGANNMIKDKDEFCQEHLGETVVGLREITKDEYLKIADKNNNYLDQHV